LPIGGICPHFSFKPIMRARMITNENKNLINFIYNRFRIHNALVATGRKH
jgi:hypothetical protein